MAATGQALVPEVYSYSHSDPADRGRITDVTYAAGLVAGVIPLKVTFNFVTGTTCLDSRDNGDPLYVDTSFPPAGSDGRQFFNPSYDGKNWEYGDSELRERAGQFVDWGAALLALQKSEPSGPGRIEFQG